MSAQSSRLKSDEIDMDHKGRFLTFFAAQNTSFGQERVFSCRGGLGVFSANMAQHDHPV